MVRGVGFGACVRAFVRGVVFGACVRALVRGVAFGACSGADAFRVGEDVLGVADGDVGRLVLAGAAELDWPVPAVGFATLRSFRSRAVTKIPMPIRATTATAAARPRRREGWLGG